MRSTLSASLTLSLCPVSVSKLRIQRFESSCSTSVSTWRTMVGQHGHGFWMNMQFLSPLVIGLELHGQHWNAYGTLYIYTYMHLGKLISWTDLLETLIPGLCHVNGLDTMCWTIYLSSPSIRSPICLHICRPIHAIFVFIVLIICLFWQNYLSKYLITLYIDIYI